MNSIALRRDNLAGVLASLSVDDMAWAMKFLADKMTFRLRTKEHVGTADSEVLERNKTERFLERVCGTWVDDKDANTQEVPFDLLSDPEISKTLEEVKVSAFSEDELRAYDKFWDSVRVEKTLQHDSYQEGRAEGRAEGIVEGRAEGIAEGRAAGASDEKVATAKRMLSAGFTPEQVAVATSLSVGVVEKL